MKNLLQLVYLDLNSTTNKFNFMKFSVNSSVLGDAFQIIHSVWKSSIEPQILSTILFSYDEQNNKLKLTCTNKDIQISTTVDVVIKESSELLSLCLQGSMMFPLVNQLNTDMEIEWTNNGMVTISAPNKKYEFVAFPPNAFPELNHIENTTENIQTLMFQSKDLYDRLNKVCKAVSTDIALPGLMHICLDLNDGVLCAVGSNGHMIEQFAFDESVSIDIDKPILIPPKVVSALMTESNHPCTIISNDKYITITSDQTQITFVNSNLKYPAFQKVLNQERLEDGFVVLDSKELLMAIQSMTPFLNPNHPSVELSIDCESLDTPTISAVNNEKNQNASFSLSDVENDMISFTVKFSAPYLTSILKNLDCEFIKVIPPREKVPGPYFFHNFENSQHLAAVTPLVQ